MANYDGGKVMRVSRFLSESLVAIGSLILLALVFFVFIVTIVVGWRAGEAIAVALGF
jgi:hypothetical protein